MVAATIAAQVPDWYERITQETPPDILAEHDLRYALSAPLIVESALWCDLGCGNGIGAATALAGRRPGGRVVLVDNDAEAIAVARSELAVADAVALTADLASADGLARVREHVGGEEGTVVTCFEVIEHLEDFVPLVTMLTELVEGGGSTVVLSVPNDAFWNLRNPYHLAKWGEGAMAELRSVLPEGHVVLHQVALSGSAVLPEGADERFDVGVQASAAGPPTHFIVAMGAQAERVRPGAQVAQVDVVAHRSWERQREAHLAVAEATIAKQSKWFEEWRRHIHGLEKELGRRPSSTGDDDSPPS
jgi:2-polyprenyl-3-methyl-5-hydroxy-6-metoxy-1,4-benzoquinol methylase